jgi:hypothetical protein
MDVRASPAVVAPQAEIYRRMDVKFGLGRTIFSSGESRMNEKFR